ncbi:class I SAM-dependent methyltransferase (plasmid) [Bradyrhizobium elkanii]|uniref:class I SAM-dependent methyltransferase n=1 Tax=Bradyrhizobium elkanii TaxID=29448 RepID=UPI00271522D5|nr:class I SAM-dependent methyltransferase [Bradyrhizobium elkanii]WLB14820.1 class I SAM-dependent methyltransferase [Bradyrhizobium elkanii]WLB69088.1 class I SAM-dependent methyltransferase [Bradyrhizobium elkanii]
MTEMLQDEQEIAAFADLMKAEGVVSYLEIGSKFGGSLRRVGEVLPPGSVVVSVDLPKGTKAWAQSEPSLKSVMADLKAKWCDTHLIWGNSTDQSVIDQVNALGPFDCVFIDGDHRLPGLTRDWINYGPLGRMVAFHDISWRRAPDWVGTRIDVPEFWSVLKADYRHQEFKFCPTGKNNGIGVLWRS